MGWQKIGPEHIDQVAEAQAKVLAFLGTKPKDLKCDAMIYQAVMDWAVCAIEKLSDVDTVLMLKYVGRPLTHDEMLRWFFGR